MGRRARRAPRRRGPRGLRLRRARRCGAPIELQDALADETRARPELPLTVGIGLDAGEAVPVGDGYPRRRAQHGRPAVLLGGRRRDHRQRRPRPPGGSDAGARVRGAAAEGAEGHRSTRSTRCGSPRPSARRRRTPCPGADVERADARRAPADRAAGGPRRRAALAALALAPRAPRPRPDRRRVGPAGHRQDAARGRARHASSTPTAAGCATCPAGRAPTPRTSWPATRRPDAPRRRRLGRRPSPLPRAVVAIAGRAAETPTLLLAHPPRGGGRVADSPRRAARDPRAATDARPARRGRVRSIATLYAGRAAEALPIRDDPRRVGGVPAADPPGRRRLGSQQRHPSGWGRRPTGPRRGGGPSATAEDELIGDVAELELVRERSRRLALDIPSDGVAASSASAIAICPYKGLAAFDGADAEYYFGRERLVAELVARVVGSPFLGLIGASGSGKSSALRAGLLPALAAGVLPGSDRWPRWSCGRPTIRSSSWGGPSGGRSRTRRSRSGRRRRPGRRARRPAADRQLLLAIDQFEEVFTATRDDAERSAFLELLTANRPGPQGRGRDARRPLRRRAAYPALARLLGGSQVLVGPLTALGAGGASSRRPRERVGLRVEPELTRAAVERRRRGARGPAAAVDVAARALAARDRRAG